MREMLVVAKRELLERVKTRWFAAVTLLGPFLMVAMIVIPAYFATRGANGAHIYIIDATGKLGKPIADDLDKASYEAEVVPDKTNAQLNEDIRKKRISGFLRLPKDAIDGGVIAYEGDNASSQMVSVVLQQVVAAEVRNQRAVELGLKEADLDKLKQPVIVTTNLNTGEGATTSGTAAFFIGYILSFLLYMVITLYCVGVMRSVVTEKTSRVMEFMVAAVKPRDLMGGKILGVGAAGLIQISIWLTAGGLALANKDVVLGWFGIHGGGALPELGADAIAVVIAYFVLGYFFYSAVFAAVGALVSSEQDTQQVQMPVTMVLVVGILCFSAVSGDPRGTASSVLTQIPLWSPMLMPMRYLLGGASMFDLALSLGILHVSTVVVVRAAAKIYRIGILMYGKRPGAAEVLRWLRHP